MLASMMTRPTSGHAAPAALACALLLCLATTCAAQRAVAPTPPPRPASLPAEPQGAPAEPVPAPSAPLAGQPPPQLPKASRARMRECGRKWEEMKRAGKDAGLVWRGFAMDCLAGK